jgi:hypothetical protein
MFISMADEEFWPPGGAHGKQLDPLEGDDAT